MLTPHDIERLERTPLSALHGTENDATGGPQCTAICSFLPTALSVNICPSDAREEPVNAYCTAVCSFLPTRLSYNICVN